MENQGFPMIYIEKTLIKYLEKNMNQGKIGGNIPIVLPV